MICWFLMQRLTKRHNFKRQTTSILITTQYCELPQPSPHSLAPHTYKA